MYGPGRVLARIPFKVNEAGEAGKAKAFTAPLNQNISKIPKHTCRQDMLAQAPPKNI